jgi:hypothetical protein
MGTSIEMTQCFQENVTILNRSPLSLLLISYLWKLSTSRRAFRAVAQQLRQDNHQDMRQKNKN